MKQQQENELNMNTDDQLYGSKLQQMKIIKAWKSKSLNSKYLEKYKLILDAPKSQQIKDLHKDKNDKFQPNKQQANKKQQKQKAPPQPKSDILPQPKIIKISQQIFCVYFNNMMSVFKLLNELQRQLYKPKDELQKTFLSRSFYFPQKIKFIIGNNSDFIYIVFENQLLTYKVELKEQKHDSNKVYKNFKDVVEYDRKAISRIKGVSFIRELKNEIQQAILVVITNQKLLKYKLIGSRQELREPLQQIKIITNNKKNQLAYDQVKTIQIVCENNLVLYLFATLQGIQQQMSQKSQGGKDKKCQFLYLIKFNLDVKNGQSIQLNISMIDHVFDTGIFSKSKVFQVGHSVFLISLFEEIIVVKYHFQKYVVWDNISLAPSKSSQKKGQLVLADKIVMVYTQAGQIYAHNIYFCWDQYKLKYPRIDNFKGTAGQQQILYDAMVLQFQKGSFMKVLFYFKQTQVYTPNNKYAVHKQEKGQNQHRQLNMQIRCIQQNQPVIKLQQLFRGKKTPQQISQFVQRFNIAQIQKSKCEWSVSDKTQKDIQNLLLEIKDNQYIQNQLTTILKSKAHDLKFLGRIQKKQIQRYKKMLATKLLKNDQDADPENLSNLYQNTGSYFTKDQVNQIKKIIQWVMESIMFQKKLMYSKNFLQFMQYDFIQIGKLKAASLKQQINLLSCKGYKKRLQYFLNSFKYMILANFQDIFQFLIDNKNQSEVQQFFKDNFPFILPKFEENSEIFAKKRNISQREKYSRERRTSFAPIMKQFKQYDIIKQQDKCQLWQDKFNDSNQIKKIQTKESFRKQIQQQIQSSLNSIELQRKQKQKQRSNVLKQCLPLQSAKKQFSIILDEFVRQDWFKNNKSKQHSIIQIQIKDLQTRMKYFKRIGVFHLLIKFFYHKISQGIYTIQKVDQILRSFKQALLIPQSFEQNILARRQIYRKISKIKKSEVYLPLLQDFLILQQTDYFDYIFLNYRQIILKQIKQVYDNILAGLFKQKFQIYLNSQKIQLTEIIKFLQFFEGNSNVDIRLDIFTCIKNLLRVDDKRNTQFFVNKLMELQILKKEGSSSSGIDSLIDQAKIAFGFYFYNFFAIFQIQQTYKQIINQTQAQDYQSCHIIKTILQKYCSNNYHFFQIPEQQRAHLQSNQNSQQYSQPQFQHQSFQQSQILQNQCRVVFQPCFNLQQISIQIYRQPLYFWGVILYLIDTLRFQISSELVFDKFIQLELKEENYGDIVQFFNRYQRKMRRHNSDPERSDSEDEQYKPRNQVLLKMFYKESDFQIKDRVINNILIWTRKQYKNLFDIVVPSLSSNYYSKKYVQVFDKVTKAFQNVIQPLKIQNADIIRQKSFLSILKNINQIQPKLVYYILQLRFQNFNGNYLQQNSPLLNTVSSFIFMIRLLNQIPKSKFDEKEQKVIMNQIYLMDCIYELFKNASRFDENSSSGTAMEEEEPGLMRFFMELAMRLIKDKQFVYCKILINKKCHFKDVFYQFLALIQQNQLKPSESQFKKFIQDFIQISHEKNISKNFSAFISQNGIKFFQGAKQLQDDKTKQSASFIVEKVSANFLNIKEQPEIRERRKSRSGIQPFKKDKQKNFGNFGAFKNFNHFQSQQQPVEPTKFTSIIFECLIQSHRVDEAFYFLIRNPMLNIVKAIDLAYNAPSCTSYALVSIYLKCLKNFLCDQFYPTFSFYKNKHQILLNQFQRKDIIKDINIAISRLKQMISQLKLQTSQPQRSLQLGKKMVHQYFDKKISHPPAVQDLDLISAAMQDVKNTEATKKIQAQQRAEKVQALKNKLKTLEQHLQQLIKLYEKFMLKNHLDPIIKLNEDDIKQGKLKLQYMSNDITPDYIDGSNRNTDKSSMPRSPRFDTMPANDDILKSNRITVQQLNRKTLINDNQLQNQKKKIKQNPQFIELQQQINNQIRQTKMLGQKYQQSQIKIPKKDENKFKLTKAYKDLKQKQKSQIESIKQSYKSQTAQRVNQILQDIKLRKSKIYEKSDIKSKYSKVSVQQSQQPRSRKDSFQIPSQLNMKSKINDLISPPNLHSHKRESSNVESNASQNQPMQLSRKYQVHVVGVDGNHKNLYMPVTMSKDQKSQASRISIHSKQKQSNVQQIVSKVQSAHNASHLTRSNVKGMNNIEQLIKLFHQKQPQCVKYIQKLEIVKNNVQVGLQITKNIYSIIYNFQNFIKFLGFVLEHYPKYKQSLQQKAYKIASQSLGIQTKINLKQLFPLQFFTTVSNAPIKQYYKIAYDTIRPNLLKILSKPQTNIHGLAILFRFGFGSENVYYYRVYEDYIRVVLKEYTEMAIDQKRMFVLAEKLRTYYGNILPQGRQNKFQLLLRQVKDENKRKSLVKQMIKILDRRGEMLTGEKQTDLRDVLVKMS